MEYWKRKKNETIIIYNVMKSKNKSKAERNKHDKGIVKSILTLIEILIDKINWKI